MAKTRDTREAKLARAYEAMRELYRLGEELNLSKVCKKAGISRGVFKAGQREEVHPDWQTLKDEIEKLQQKQSRRIEKPKIVKPKKVKPTPAVTYQLKEQIAEKIQVERDYEVNISELLKVEHIASERTDDLVELQRLNSHYIDENQSLADENRSLTEKNRSLADKVRSLTEEISNLKKEKKETTKSRGKKKKKVVSLKERREEKKLALERNNPSFLVQEAIEKLSKAEISKYRTKAKRQLKQIKDKISKEAYEEALRDRVNRLVAEDFGIELEQAL